MKIYIIQKSKRNLFGGKTVGFVNSYHFVNCTAQLTRDDERARCQDRFRVGPSSRSKNAARTLTARLD